MRIPANVNGHSGEPSFPGEGIAVHDGTEASIAKGFVVDSVLWITDGIGGDDSRSILWGARPTFVERPSRWVTKGCRVWIEILGVF